MTVTHSLARPHVGVWLVALVLAILFSLCSPRHAAGADYFVRPDGGSASQCTGTANAPYPGSGGNQPCAWDHPFRALPPGGTPRIVAGDTLHVASGSYMIGYGAPGSDACDASTAWGCVMPPVPSGTKILGDCGSRPELWGTERAYYILDLTGASNVEVGCFEITDHSTCVDGHSGSIACQRDTAPFGPWAAQGIVATDSSNVFLHDLNIHGLAEAGVRAGRLRDWTVTDVRIAGNGYVGWDGDVDGSDSNSGTLRFTRWTVEWNGCGETWPQQQPVECWAQDAGGYGDGVGTGETQGHWIIEQSAFLHNTSDGLDLLYARPGSSIEIRRTIAYGNAGNQIKTSGPVTIENSIIVSNCGFFDGNPVTFNVDNCRAMGNALSISLFKGDRASVTNTTIASEGDCEIVADCFDGAVCDGSERVVLRNNILVGTTEFLDPNDRSCAMYSEILGRALFDDDYSILFGTKQDSCPGPHDLCDTDPLLASEDVDHFDARLRKGSPAIGFALKDVAPIVDYAGRIRGASVDAGALEFVLRRRLIRR